MYDWSSQTLTKKASGNVEKYCFFALVKFGSFLYSLTCCENFDKGEEYDIEKDVWVEFDYPRGKSSSAVVVGKYIYYTAFCLNGLQRLNPRSKKVRSIALSTPLNENSHKVLTSFNGSFIITQNFTLLSPLKIL